MTARPTQAAQRYHGLDGLRGFAMLLGIVLHATIPYFSRLANVETLWPADDDQSVLMFVVFDFIHIWRMPVFFVLAGFFAHLVLARRPDRAFVEDRLLRIALPLLIFGPVMAVTIPVIWHYGWTGVLSLDIFRSDRPDLESSGYLVAHLWFLYYLLLMYAVLMAFRFLAGLTGAGTAIRLSIARYLGNGAYTLAPVVLALAAVGLLLLRGEDESKPLWPLNLPDVLYGLLFFLYGYGLYARRELIERLRRRRVVAALWLAAAPLYVAHIGLVGALDEAAELGREADAIAVMQLADTVLYGTLAALMSVGMVGLFELVLRSPRAWIRWLADASYWIYIIHLPVIAFLTFYLAHLDRQGRLDAWMGVEWGPELKFTVACLVTGAIGVLTYRYLVRHTPLGVLLNGKRPTPGGT